MKLSKKFKNSVKLSPIKGYELAGSENLTQTKFSSYLHGAGKIIGHKTNLIKIGKRLGLTEEECFEEDEDEI